jgi:hypothetical protein
MPAKANSDGARAEDSVVTAFKDLCPGGIVFNASNASSSNGIAHSLAWTFDK